MGVWEEVDLVVGQAAAQAAAEWEAAEWEAVAKAEGVKEVGLVVARGAREGDGRRRDGDGDGGGGEAEAYDAAAGAGGAALSVWKLQTAGVLHPPKPYG